MLLNTEEITSMFHFPIPTLSTPRISWLKAKSASPPENLPDATEGDGIELGDSIYRGETRSVRLLREDRRRHLYIVGQTGTGKSTLLQDMIRQDIEHGEGVGEVMEASRQRAQQGDEAGPQRMGLGGGRKVGRHTPANGREVAANGVGAGGDGHTPRMRFLS